MSTPIRSAACGLLLAACCDGNLAVAHEFWIEPSSFRPAVGEPVEVGLRVGDLPQLEPVPRNPDRIERFVVVGPGGEEALPGEDGKDPAGSFRPGQPGLYVIAYRSRQSRIELEPDKFEAYLREVGLDRVIEERAASGQSGQPGREVYSRCAKSLVVAGEPGSAAADEALGLRLELVARDLLHSEAPRGAMSVQLLFEGKPCAGVLVKAWGPDRAAPPVSARSDADGRVTLPVTGAGSWVIAAVHMVAAPQGSNADWESLWASLTLDPKAGTAAPAR